MRRVLGIRAVLVLSFLVIVVAPVAVALLVYGITSAAADQPGSRLAYGETIRVELRQVLAPHLAEIVPLVEEVGALLQEGGTEEAEAVIKKTMAAPSKSFLWATVDILRDDGKVMARFDGPGITDPRLGPLGRVSVPVPPGDPEPGITAVGPYTGQYLWVLAASGEHKLFGRMTFPISAILPETGPSPESVSAAASLASGVATFVLLVVLLSWRLSRRILVPLRLLGHAAGRIAAGNLDDPVGHDRADEFGRLAAAFEDMRLRLRASLLRLQENDAERRQMLAGVTHDLKTPLTSIRGYVEGLRDGVADNRGARDRYFAIVLEQTEKLEQLIDSLFRLARLELDDAVMEMGPVSSRELFQEIFERAARDAAAAGVGFVGPQPIPDRRIRVDAAAIRQVVDNLVQNAKRFLTPPGSIRCSVMETPGALEISIADNGPGFSEEDLPRVFDLFYRGDRARTSRAGEAGLGLTMCKRIVERHGGTIRAENGRSAETRGAVITFTLPLDQASA